MHVMFANAHLAHLLHQPLPAGKVIEHPILQRIILHTSVHEGHGVIQQHTVKHCVRTVCFL